MGLFFAGTQSLLGGPGDEKLETKIVGRYEAEEEKLSFAMLLNTDAFSPNHRSGHDRTIRKSIFS